MGFITDSHAGIDFLGNFLGNQIRIASGYQIADNHSKFVATQTGNGIAGTDGLNHLLGNTS